MTDTSTTAFVPVGRNRSALIDADDLPLVTDHRWQAHERRGTYGAVTEIDGIRTYMHSVILGVGNGARVYHLNGDRLDNRRANLSLTPSVRPSSNTMRPQSRCGYVGVRYHERDRRWLAYLRVHRRTIHLGSYRSAVEAALAYDVAARLLIGGGAHLNEPDASQFRPASVQKVVDCVRLRVSAFESRMAVPHIDSTSRYRGVSYSRSDRAWRSSIQVDGERRSLGQYATPQEAARAYDQAAWEVLGTGAALNFPPLGIGADTSATS